MGMIEVGVDAATHADETGHSIQWNKKRKLWACLQCKWKDAETPAPIEIPEEAAHDIRVDDTKSV